MRFLACGEDQKELKVGVAFLMGVGADTHVAAASGDTVHCSAPLVLLPGLPDDSLRRDGQPLLCLVSYAVQRQRATQRKEGVSKPHYSSFAVSTNNAGLCPCRPKSRRPPLRSTWNVQGVKS